MGLCVLCLVSTQLGSTLGSGLGFFVVALLVPSARSVKKVRFRGCLFNSSIGRHALARQSHDSPHGKGRYKTIHISPYPLCAYTSHPQSVQPEPQCQQRQKPLAPPPVTPYAGHTGTVSRVIPAASPMLHVRSPPNPTADITLTLNRRMSSQRTLLHSY